MAMSERGRADKGNDRKDVVAALSALQSQVDEQGRRLRDLEARLDAVEARAEGRRATVEDLRRRCGCSGSTCATDLIGCLEDCVKDAEELRRKVRDARSAGPDR